MKDRGSVTADFNNYILPGIYGYDGGPSVLNAPGSVAGNLEVIVTTSYVIQRITVYDRTYTRRYNGSVWTTWTSYLSNADMRIVRVTATTKNGSNIVTATISDLKPGKACIAMYNTNSSNYILNANCSVNNILSVTFANNFATAGNVILSVIFEL